jgi:hypothetical protein
MENPQNWGLLLYFGILAWGCFLDPAQYFEENISWLLINILWKYLTADCTSHVTSQHLPIPASSNGKSWQATQQ